MYVIVPEFVTEATLSASNVTEADYAAWSSVTAYTVGQRVILTTGYHKVYECVGANTNKHPVTDPAAATYWLEVSATNRWKAFDRKISDPTTRAGNITYTIAPTMLTDSAAFFGLSASSVTVVVKDGVTTLSTSTVDLVDRTGAVDWFSWFYDDIVFDPIALITDFNATPGNTIEITVAGSSNVEVGEIVLGRNRQLGDTNVGSGIGIKDYSRKERDSFGNPIIVERAFSDLVDYKFTFPATDARRVKSLLAGLRSTPAVYHAGPDTLMFGTTVFGFYTGFEIPLTDRNMSFATMQIEGLV